MAYIFLAVAIITEIFGASMLKLSEGFTRALPAFGTVIGYGISFYFLSLTLKLLPISITYATWAGVGTALTAVIGVLFWKETFSLQTVLGVSALVIGVALLNMPKLT